MTTVQPSLVRMRWAVRAVLALGVTASTVANILHADDNPISQTIAAWPPLALLLTVELISRVPVHRRGLAAARLAATASIAGIAAWVSYWHMVGVAARYGETGPSPYLLPLSVDGLVVVASICLVELSGRIAAPDTTADRPVPVPSAPVVDEPAVDEPSVPVVRPIRAVAASTPRRRTTSATIRASSRPQVDLPTALRLLDEAGVDRRTVTRDKLAAIVRAASYSLANGRARDLLAQVRAA